MDPGLRQGDELVEKWDFLRGVRQNVTQQIEHLRRDKIIGSSLEVSIRLRFAQQRDDFSALTRNEWAELLICADVYELVNPNGQDSLSHPGHEVSVTRTTHHKCGRCWRHLPDVTADGALCSRCDHVVGAMEAAS